MKKLSYLILFIAVAGLALVLRSNLSTQSTVASASQEQNFDLANYVTYSNQNLELSKSRGKSLLFFAATNWCQSCSLLEDEILERSQEIPPGVTILKVDYDNDKEMNKQFFVTIQHTLVLLDEQGNELTRWVGGDFNDLKYRLNNFLN